MVFFNQCAVDAVLLAVVGRMASASKFPANIRLVAVGGAIDGNFNQTSDVDIISPSNNKHTKAAAMSRALNGFGRTVINNTLYTVGGWRSGYSVGTKTFTSFDASANTWTNLPEFPNNIGLPGVVAIGNVIYVLGGVYSGADEDSNWNLAYKYNIATGAWKQITTPWPLLVPGPAPEPVSCALAYGNDIYLLFEDGDLFRSADAAQTWTKLATMSHWRSSPSCVVLNTGKILVAGGAWAADRHCVPADRYDCVPDTINQVETYDISSDSWSSAPNMTKPRQTADAVVVTNNDGQDVAVICGGYQRARFADKYFDDCELFSELKNKWVKAPFSLDMPRWSYGLVVTQV